MIKSLALSKHPLFIRIAHWIMSPLIIGNIILAYIMMAMENTPDKFSLYDLHKSIGVLLAMALIARMIARLVKRYTIKDKFFFKPLEVRLSSFVIMSFYLVILLMVASGISMSCYGGYGVKFFGLPLQCVVAKNESIAITAHTVHEYSGYGLITLISLHLIGYLKHLLIDKKNILGRIL